MNFAKFLRTHFLQNISGRLLLDFFFCFAFFFATQWTPKNLLKLTGKQLYRSLLFNEVTRYRPTTLLKRDLWVKHNFLETYFIEYLRMVPSETTTTKECKLCIVCTNYFSQQAKWLWGETRCALMKRNCVLFYLIIILRKGNQARFELFSKIF